MQSARAQFASLSYVEMMGDPGRPATATTYVLGWLALIILVAGGCYDRGTPHLGSSERAIVGGTETTGWPAVVLTQTGTGQCTGTLIAPRVVLTAAHCIYDSVVSGQTSSGSVSFGSGFNMFSDEIGVADMFMHRYYDPNVIRSFDIGLIRLREDAAIQPMAWNQLSIDESFVGGQVTIVGFGVTDGEEQTGAGLKRQVSLTIDEVTSEHIGLGDELRNICQGDSGGPTIMNIDGVDTVMAVSSFGSNFCLNRSFVTRTDIYKDDFLLEVIDAWDGVCQANSICTDSCPAAEGPDPDCGVCGLEGACGIGCPKVDLDCPVAGFGGAFCLDDDDCESRKCIDALDDPRVRYCSNECDPTADAQAVCDPPLTACESSNGENVCIYNGITPSTQGAQCGGGGECRSQICDSKEGICVELCETDDDCTLDYSCVSIESLKVCTVPRDGGCAAASPSRDALGAGMLLLLFFCVTSRRRRSAEPKSMN